MTQDSTPTPTKDMLGRKALIGVDEAVEILLTNLEGSSLPSESIALEDALDRITATPIHSKENLPSHPRSTMDGYAVCSTDTFGASESMPCYLQITGEVFMGEQSVLTVSRGNCLKIATGGLLPDGADAVVMFEHTVPVDETMIEVVKSVGSGSNIIQTGDDIAMGKEALPAGRVLKPQDLGLLAGLGIAEVEVHQSVRVGILSTGDEIVPHTEMPQPGKIRNINSIAIGNAAKRLGAEITDYGIVDDNEQSFFAAIEKAKAENDLVIFSGGSSVGTRDLGERAIETLGSPGVLVHGVTLKPGKPILIGLHGNTPIFGLPGHPVSAMVCFDLFVSEAIKQLSGLNDSSFIATITATLARNIASAPGRRDIVRVQLSKEDETFIAEPVLGKSGSISTLSRAHGYIVIPEPLQGLTEKSEVEVYLYQ